MKFHESNSIAPECLRGAADASTCKCTECASTRDCSCTERVHGMPGHACITKAVFGLKPVGS
eukprot:12014356-Alexandrium_andersonii.AAC.1